MIGVDVRPPARGPHARARRLALRETVEAFTAADGNIYVLRGGTDAEFVVEDPSPFERAIVELLHAPVSAGELEDVLAARGHDVTPGSVDDVLASLEDLALVEEQPPRYDGLDDETLARYDRQLPYFADLAGPGRPAAAAQQRLLGATVVVIGCGGLGSWAATGLACSGVGRLVLVDDDTVELSNLNRQLLFRRDDVGRRKVDAAASALRAFNPALVVDVVPARVSGADDVERLARGADLVIATADHPPQEIARWVNLGCFRAGVPWIGAAQFPPFVRVGPLFRPGVTGCHACEEHAAREGFPDFDALVAYRRRRTVNAATLGPPSGLIGSILSMDAVHLITGLASPATEGKALLLDIRGMSVEADEVTRVADCAVCGGL